MRDVRGHKEVMTNSLIANADRPSYDDQPIWQRYQEFFPEAMRCTPTSTPREEWWSWRGLNVHLDRLEVPTSPIKVIVLHGAGANGRIMAPCAVIAQRYGFETVAPDLPGYGLTKVPRSKMEYGLWIDCVVDLIDQELARDDRPVVLFGVSLGGLLAYQAAAKSRKVIGLIVTTLTDPRESEVRQGFARTPLLGSAGLWLLQSLAPITDGLPMPMAYMSKMHAISNDPKLSALCMSDRTAGGSWVPARFLRTMMNTAPDLEPEEFNVCPVLLAHPGEDRMTDIELSRRFFNRLSGQKKMVVLDGASHKPIEQPGVAQLESDVIEFLRGVVANHRSLKN